MYTFFCFFYLLFLGGGGGGGGGVMNSATKASVRKTAKLALAAYTLLRVVANLAADGWDDLYLTCDAVLRPVITGLGVFFFLRRNDRFSEKSSLHIWSRRTIFWLALFVGDAGFRGLSNSLFKYDVANGVCIGGTLVWEIVCNIMQVHLTNLKLRALGRSFTAKLCHIVALTGFSSMLVALISYAFRFACDAYICGNVVDMFAGFLVSLSLLFCFATLFTQCCSLCIVACAAWRARGVDEAVRSMAFVLFGNALLVILGPALSLWSWSTYAQMTTHFLENTEESATVSWLTPDLFFQICNILALSGMVGPKKWNRPMDAFRQLADLSGFGFASKRVVFPGHINRKAAKCVVSFPGKYSDLWDEAVSAVTSQAVDTRGEQWSLACVFLTDADSGLGQHSENPDTPGKCWCHSIYGRVPAETYLSVVEVDPEHIDSQANRQMLSFKRSDAKAMGQLLVIKSDQSETEWQIELAEATERAQQLCLEKDGRAPWGCQWFEEWKQNVDLAAQLGQELHVFYFEERKGQGKVPWDQLCDEAAKERARQSSGLGASQTAEVAYLEKMGLTFVEHDIRDFKAFIAGAR